MVEDIVNEIQDELHEEIKRSRGRPKKAPIIDETEKVEKKRGRPRKPTAERKLKIVGRPRKPKPTEPIQKAPIGRPRIPITIIKSESKGKTHICENCNNASL
jgi:hypothetical protein